MPPKEEKEVKEPIKNLRTYKGDIEEAMSKNKMSAGTILVAEQKRREENGSFDKVEEDHGARNKFFIFLGGILLLLGIITIGAVYYIRSNDKVNIEQQTKALIGFSQEKVMPIASSTRADLLLNTLSEKLTFKLPVNSVLYINTVDGQGSTADVTNLLSLLAPNMPPSLSRSFENKYMLGIYSFDTNEPFIILTTDDFASSFAGMLKWEESMPADLGKLFSIAQNASSTSIFVDEALKNKDLRVLRNDKDKTVLLYSFIDKNTLVITTNENILTAIIGKYLVGQQTK